MSAPFIAEIRIFGFNFAPYGWAFCNGQILSIAQNTALFSLVGTYYGGNGTSTFGLPNFQGVAPLGAGSGAGLTPRVVGETGGTASVTLLSSEMPGHNHTLLDGNGASQLQATTTAPDTDVSAGNLPAGAALGAASWNGGFSTLAQASGADMAATTTQAVGTSQAHENMPPYLALNFCIAMVGVFPSRN